MLFAQVANLHVQMETHVANCLQENGDVVPFLKLFAAVMEYIAVQMDTHAMLKMELVLVKDAAQSC